MSENGLHPEWSKVAKRLQREAKRAYPTYAVLTMRIIVNSNGSPVVWVPPSLTKFEPQKADHSWLLKMLE